MVMYQISVRFVPQQNFLMNQLWQIHRYTRDERTIKQQFSSTSRLPPKKNNTYPINTNSNMFHFLGCDTPFSLHFNYVFVLSPPAFSSTCSLISQSKST